jgi:hypothetical protein
MTQGRIPATGQTHSTHGSTAPSHRSKVLFVSKVADDGWVQARAADSATLVPLAKYTKVVLTESRSGRSYFKVMDGSARGRTLSMSDANAANYLNSKSPQSTPADVVVTYGKYVEGWVSAARGGQALDQQFATLEVGGITAQVTMNSVWDGRYTPLAAGQYTVLLPDAPHQQGMTRFYRRAEPSLKYDQVWFPIKHGDNSRYIHVGNVSEGCVTVLDLARWADIHEALISHRSADGTSVARLVVKGTPERAR